MSDQSPVSQPVLKTRRALPTGRAVLGALLVTLAALGVLLATRLNDDAAFQEVVLASRDLAPGEVVGPDDVATIRLRLDDDATWVITDVDEVVGKFVLGPVARLEFVQRSNVVDGLPNTVASGLSEVAIPIDPNNAPLALEPGEVVSLIATFEEEKLEDGTVIEEAATTLIADRVVVLSYQTGGDDIATANDTVLRIGVADGADVSAIALAADQAVISVIGVMSAPEVELPRLVRQQEVVELRDVQRQQP